MSQIIVIAHNIRSTHNIGAIFRTCEGFGVQKIIISGFSPYPPERHDSRLPHLQQKIARQIHKTALGAENLVPFEYQETPALDQLKEQGWQIVGLEQDERSKLLPNFKPAAKVALLLGEELNGINQELRSQCDRLIEIPMFGQKESFNVSVATGIALFALKYPK